MAAVPQWLVTAHAVNPSSTRAGSRIARAASLISWASIFLPRYSGVRPTIRPARKMASSTKINIP